MKILCIGDSNTYGYDPRSYLGDRYPADVRWTDRLKDWDVINCGVNGMTVPREYSRFIAQVRINEPDLVIVMLGTNDCFRGLSAVQIAERMDRFLDSIGGLTKQILLISPPVLQCGDWVQDDDMLEESQELGEQYHELAEGKGCLFADAEEWDIEMAYDGVHFSPEGHAVFAQKLEEKIKEVYEHKE